MADIQPRLPEKIKIVVSDFHLSRGKLLANGRRNPLEDFTQDERFRELLEHYSSGKYESMEVELVVNGDFFDPLVVIPLPGPDGKFPRLEYPSEVEEAPAVQKYESILNGHPVTVSALRAFLAKGKRIIFRWGNHDASLLWPAVQTLIRQRLAPPDDAQLSFQQSAYLFDRICIDHGHQLETLNHFDESKMFLERKTKDGVRTIQNLPFGSFFVFGFLNRIKLERSYITHVQPLRLYVRIALVLEPLFFWTNGFKVAWFFIKMRFVTHPMRFARLRKTAALLIESFRRVSLEEEAEKLFANPELPYDTIIMGHNHQATVRYFPHGKTYINTGTWIPITSLDMRSLGHRVQRTYALIEYFDQKPRCSLKVWHGAPQISEDFA